MLKFNSSIPPIGLVQVNVVLPKALPGHSPEADLAQGHPQGAAGYLEGKRDESQGRVLLSASWPWCQRTVAVVFNLLLSK